MDSAFYSRDGEHLVPTALTRGPWDPGHQHGGPPAALLARACEALAPPAEWHVARFTVEFLRPVPIDRPLQLRAAPTRSGQQVLTLEEILGGRYKSRSGLGLGILGTKRLADRFAIESGPGGTHVEVEVYF